jgi:fimbrial chaperone protein
MRMRSLSSSLIAAVALTAAANPAAAASLQVTPLLIEVPAPGATSTLTLRNEGPRPVNAQVRVFRWTQTNGEDLLEPTEAVVASPPLVSLASRVNYAVRVVRSSRQPVSREEAYRLVVDELPDASRARSGTVAIVLRQSIPVFFRPEDAGAPKLSWSVKTAGNRVTVTVKNAGERRVRIARLKVSVGNASVTFGNGLVGYALAGSTMSWTRPAPHGLGSGPAKISAQGDMGPINASAGTSTGR